MGRIYKFLGLTRRRDRPRPGRRGAQGQPTAADITYGTNNEFGFDYLRDNMKFRIEDCVQRDHNYAIVDEVDSILIDEARTPLIISGPSEESTDKYYKVNRIIPKPGARRSDRRQGAGREVHHRRLHRRRKAPQPRRSPKRASLKVEKLLGIGNLYDAANMELNHHVQQALQGPRALPARQGLRGRRTRRSHHRRRVHRPPDARPPLVATACTRPWRPRKASRSSARTRRWPPSPSRTISACTRSWPA